MNQRRVTVSPERLARWLEGFAERHGTTVTTATGDEVALTGADGARAWLLVPFPPLPATDEPQTALVAHALRRRTIGVLLVRRRAHATGVFDGTELIASKVDTSYVQGTTRAGGWSQQRYARRRQNQAQASYASAADIAAKVLLPHIGRLDALVCGGDRAAIEAVLADTRLTALETLRRPPFLPVADPRLRVLQETPAQFRAISVMLEP